MHALPHKAALGGLALPHKAALLATPAQGVAPFVAPAVFASIGDSTAWQATQGASGTNYFTYGVPLWLRALTNFRIPNLCPIANNLGASASYIAQMAAQIDGLVALPTDVTVQSGTNDLASGTALATMQAQYAAQVASVLQKPYVARVWLVPITPRSSGMTAELHQRRIDFNAWLAAVVSGDAAARVIWTTAATTTARQFAKLRVLDVSFATDVDGNSPNSGFVQSDGVHYAPAMARGLGSQIATYINSVVSPNPPSRTTASDLFSATTLPTGSLLNSGGVNRGLMGGIGGSLYTSTGLAPSGQMADLFRLSRAAGSAPGTLVASKEPTVNGRSGQIITYTTSGTGLASERVQIEYLGSAFGISTADGLTVGDQLVYEGESKLSVTRC